MSFVQHVIRAPSDGVVAAVLFAEGDFVEGGKLLVTFEDSDGNKDSPAARLAGGSSSGLNRASDRTTTQQQQQQR